MATGNQLLTADMLCFFFMCACVDSNLVAPACNKEAIVESFSQSVHSLKHSVIVTLYFQLTSTSNLQISFTIAPDPPADYYFPLLYSTRSLSKGLKRFENFPPREE